MRTVSQRHVAIAVVCILLTGCAVTNITTGRPQANTPEGKALRRSAAPVALARDGKALVPIVISPDASEAVLATAEELAAILGQMTGGAFRVQRNATPSGVTLGTLKQFPDRRLAKPLKIRNHYDGIEAFAIRSDEGVVRLVASTDLGVQHAAYRFLELLGCRWFFMTDRWRVIPKTAALAFDLNEDSRPAIWARNIWFDRLAQRAEPGDPSAKVQFQNWAKHNRMAKSLKVRILHRWQAIPMEAKAEFAQHPEYFALVAGKRRGPQFCVTNKGLQEAVLAYAKEYFKKHPDAAMVSLDPADQPGWCTCKGCSALGHHSAQPFYLANIVAKRLAKSHPGKYVGLLAYSWYSDPPSFTLEPNVYVQLTRGMNASKLSFEELFALWTRKCQDLGMYDYYSYWQMDRGMLPGTWVTDLKGNAARIQRYVQNGVKSISAQSSNNWGIHGLAYYLAARLMWDATADVEALRKDFLDKAFGAAAPAMGRYYARMDAANRPLRGMGLIRQAVDDVEEASRLAKGRPDVQARIDDIKTLLMYSYLGEKVLAAATPEDKKARTLDWFTWTYRIRNSHMVGWLTFRSTVGRPASVEFGEPTWFWRNTLKTPEANPWRVDTPITPEVLDQSLAAIKADVGPLPDRPAAPVKGKMILVDTGLTSRKRRGLIYSALGTFLLGSVRGEPIRIVIEERKWGIEKPPALYTLSDSAGKTVATGKLPIGTHSLELKVPGPGVYPLTCYSRGSGYRIIVPDSTPAALAYEAGRTYRQSGLLAPVYFYVPKRLSHVLMYAHHCGTVRISDSRGKVVHEAPSDGRIVRIPVPKDQAGTIWSVGGVSNMRLRRFQLLNLPTVLSLNPRYIFVSEPDAKADGLNIIAP